MVSDSRITVQYIISHGFITILVDLVSATGFLKSYLKLFYG